MSDNSVCLSVSGAGLSQHITEHSRHAVLHNSFTAVPLHSTPFHPFHPLLGTQFDDQKS